MTFTLETWREQAAEKLAIAGRWLNRGRKQELPYIVYGTVAGLTLWPLVQRAAETGQVADSLLALYGVTAGVGANLIANQIEKWKDQASQPDEDEVSTWAAEQAAENIAFRQALDDILEKLAVMPQVEASLAKEDRTWFVETLSSELGRLGNLERFQAQLIGSGAIAQGAGAVAIGAGGVLAEDVGGDVITGKKTVVYAEQGAKVVIGEEKEELTAVDRESALGRYLAHLIARNRYLQLQGIRSGGRLVHIELEHIYITLRTTQKRTISTEESWLAAEAGMAPGELRNRGTSGPEVVTETVTISINQALADNKRLVVLGDPGSGKTTLLRFLALIFARDMAASDSYVSSRLELQDDVRLPILLPLRQIGSFLSRVDESIEGHKLLLEFLHRTLANERIDVPLDFFDPYLESGQAVILLDGLDEVADSDLRRRVAQLVEAFTRAYPECRFVVTSRIVGYKGTARLGERYVTTTVRDFSEADIERFLQHWHRLVAAGQMGSGDSAETYAAEQTRQLMAAIRSNKRVRELAINPLMLTVIALVHRDRVKLPDRRAELYAEAVDVLLGKWEEAKGLREIPILEDRPFDTGDKRLMLQALALHMHSGQQKEIEGAELQRFLIQLFRPMVANERAAEQATDRFLRVIQERTGLMAARGEGVYAFSHLTFQEYLAALAMAVHDDYVAFTLARTADPWWREAILLEAGYLSTQGKERTTRLIRAITEAKEEPEPYHNLVLAAECLRDAGNNRVEGNLEEQVQAALWKELEASMQTGLLGSVTLLVTRGMTPAVVAQRRIAAATALGRLGRQRYWTRPYGEPVWLEIPAGEFVMGSDESYRDEQPQHKVKLEAFWIAPVPITNAQYHLFVEVVGHNPPGFWEDGRPPKGLENHPVTDVDWRDALAYCRWLGEVTGKAVTLPSEAEWEKAARGAKDDRVYPWGDVYDRLRCNGKELGLGSTSPVGIFPEGASPYGALDMSGNVFEWTRTLWGADFYQPDFKYPYHPDDGREDIESDGHRILRGGSFYNELDRLRCACRLRGTPSYGDYTLGFRVVVSPLPGPKPRPTSDL